VTLRLLDLEAPLDDVEFPDGAKHQPVPFGPAEYKLWREQEQETNDLRRGAIRMTILRACYPTAKDEDFALCTSVMLLGMLAHAARKINEVREALKNVGAAALEEPVKPLLPPTTETPLATLPLSSPKTNGATSSRKSRKRSGKIGGTPTTAAHTASLT
jgi:hypothetical protein